jgi:YD repeat-containing protein
VTKIRENGATSGVGVLASYSYDNAGRRTGVTYGNGTSRSYGYDAISRLTGLQMTFPNASGYNHTIGGLNGTGTAISYSPPPRSPASPRAMTALPGRAPPMPIATTPPTASTSTPATGRCPLATTGAAI